MFVTPAVDIENSGEAADGDEGGAEGFTGRHGCWMADE
jgi:hypothetical protein